MAKKAHNKAASNADATVGYEAELWQMADALRGSMDAAEYRPAPRSRLARQASGEQLRDDKRWRYGAPPVGNANFAWVQHIVHHLSPTSVAGFVLANGSMFSNPLLRDSHVLGGRK